MTVLSQIIKPDDMIKITSEFARLGDRCYLDNAGATLYPKSLITSINEDLLKNVYMNPHTDKNTKDYIEQIRCLILKHFNTDPSTYTLIFTSGTTQALKLVIESFQFMKNEDDDLNCGSFVYLEDNHTSVVGLRELAVDKDAEVVHIAHEDFLNVINTKAKQTSKYTNGGNCLVAYPAQSNFNGFKYPLNCIENIKNGCLNNHLKKHLCEINSDWYVLLDAAAYVATSKLDLAKVQPDFVSLSFYKIFGFPTGLGALLVKKSSENVLSQKRYFGGGTVDALLSNEHYHIKREIFHERFEDGSLSFLSIISLKQCLDTMYRIIPRIIHDDIMETISYHTFYLAKDLYCQLLDLRHRNGTKAIKFYLDSDFSDITKQGGVLTFNLVREDGTYIGFSEFQHMADLFNISVRTGCFCNSGSCQRHLHMSNKDMKDMYNAGHRCGDEVDLINEKPTGAIRISFGYYNTFEDVDKFVNMICRCFVNAKARKQKRIINHFVETPKIKHYNGNVNKIINEHIYFKNVDDVLINIPPMSTKIILKEICIFPIKSCGAFKILSGWNIGPKGFEYDREWMIVKDNGVCLTQKQNTRMCMIRPQIDLKQKVMILNFPGKTPISIPLENSIDEVQKNGSLCHSKVCTDIIKGIDCGDEVADWISEALEVSFLRLIRQSSNDNRSLKKKKDEDKKLLSLSNQAQYLLINKATVKWLSEKIKDPLFTDDLNHLTDRFRGNLIIEMEQELLEREWHSVIIGNHEFKVEGQCPRCQMVCIDQQTGEKTVEPLRTIAEQFGGKLRFGIYLSYVGTVNKSDDRTLKTYSPIKAILNDDNISR